MNKHDATIYLKGIKDFYGLDKDSEEAIDVAIEALSTERTGEWVIHRSNCEGLADLYECDQCGEEVIGEPANFCPDCGAKMSGDTESNDRPHYLCIQELSKVCDECKLYWRCPYLKKEFGGDDNE